MLLSVISAILLILSFPNFDLSNLAFIGFVPLLFAVQNRIPKKAFIISYFCGFFFYMGVLYWLYNVTIPGLLVLCLYLALYFGIFGFFVSKSVFLAPLIWVIIEYIQSRLFTGFGWALLGYSQYRNLPLIQIADFSGVYGVSFVIMTVNVAVWSMIKGGIEHRAKSKEQRVNGIKQRAKSEEQSVKNQGSREKKSLCPMLLALSSMLFATLLLTSAYAYGFFRLGEKEKPRTIKVSVIQGNIPQEVKWDSRATQPIVDRYITLTQNAALDKPDLIVWPETSFPEFLAEGEGLTDYVVNSVAKIRFPLLLGANTERDMDIFNSAVLISGEGAIAERYDKIHLVPYGEYVPFSDRFPILHRMILGELGDFKPGKEFKIFKIKPEGIRPEVRFGALICFEDIFPELARAFVREGAEFLIVITNDAWYGKSGAAYQHASSSVFRAIENRVSVVRCANTGYSCFIDSRGRIYDSVEVDTEHLFVTGYKTSEVTY